MKAALFRTTKQFLIILPGIAHVMLNAPIVIAMNKDYRLPCRYASRNDGSGHPLYNGRDIISVYQRPWGQRKSASENPFIAMLGTLGIPSSVLLF